MDALSDPIVFFFEEHERQLEICARLEDLATATDSDSATSSAASLLEFFTKDLPLHIEHEERDLFPLLASRQDHDLDLPVILDQLISEHELDRDLMEPIIQDLRQIAEGLALADARKFHVCARTFTEAMRRHLNWENRVVLPLAERVLGDRDCVNLGRSIAERRRDFVRGGG